MDDSPLVRANLTGKITMSISVNEALSTTPIPRIIEKKLSSVVKRFQSNERTFRYGGWATLVMTAALVMVTVDLFFEIDTSMARLVGWIIAVTSVVILALLWQRRLHNPLSWIDAAWRVEDVRPDMEERLTSTVELLSHNELFSSAPAGSAKNRSQATNDRCDRSRVHDTIYSPRLIDALSREATDRISTVDSDELPMRATWPVHLVVGCLLTLLFCVTAANPEAVACSFRNWMMPWATPIFPVLQADVQPGDTTIVEGEELQVLTGSFRRGEKPLLEYWLESDGANDTDPANILNGEWVEVASVDDSDVAKLPQLCATLTSLSSDTNYRLRLGKRTSKTYRVRVLSQPKILSVTAQVTFPPYTELPAETFNDTSAVIPLLSGSEVAVRITPDQHAQQAELRWLDAQAQVESANDFAFDLKCVEQKQMLGEIRLKSADGVYGPALPIKIDVHPDQPPTVELLDPTLLKISIERDRELAVQYDVSDDFKIQQLELLYQATDAHDDAQPYRILIPLDARPNGEPFRSQGTVFVEFDPLPAESHGATVWLRASDNRTEPFGGPQTTESGKIVVDFQASDATPLEQRLVAEQQAIEQALEATRQELAKAFDQAEQLVGHLEENDLRDSVPKLTEQTIDKELKVTREQINASRQAAERLAETLEQTNSNHTDLARATEQMAQEHIDAAGRQIDRAELANNPQDMRQPTNQSKDQLDQAIDELDKIEKRIQQRIADLRTTAKLEDLARRQQKLANEVQPGAQVTEQKVNAAKADQDLAPDSKPTPPAKDWKRRQEQVADEIATMAERNGKPENDAAGPQNREPEEQAESAGRLAEQAERLAAQWDQANERPKDDAGPQKEKLIQQIDQLREDAAQLAEQNLPSEEIQNQLDDARQDLKRAAEKVAEQAEPNQQGQRPPVQQQPDKRPPDAQDAQTQQLGTQQPDKQQAEMQQGDKQQPAKQQSDVQKPNNQNPGKPQPDVQQPKQQLQPGQNPLERPGQTADQTPANLLRQASKAFQSVCKSCRQGSNGQQPVSRQDLAQAQQQSDAAAKATDRENAEQHAQQAAETLSKLSDQAAKATGLRKNCDKCKSPGNGLTTQSDQPQKPGTRPNGTKGFVEQPFEQLPLRGESGSGWTRAKRQLEKGVLDGREAMIPEAFRDVVSDYFQALSKDTRLSEKEADGVGTATDRNQP